MKKLLWFALLSAACLLLADAANAQGVRYDNVALLDSGRPAGGATWKVCSAGSTGTPCTPAASCFSDQALSTPIAGCTSSADTRGNYGFYIACGQYDVQLSGAGMTTATYKNVQIGPCGNIPGSLRTLGVTGSTSGSALIQVPAVAGTPSVTLLPGVNSGTVSRVQVASDFTLAANTSLQTITGLSWTFPAVAGNYSFHCALAYSQATAAVADALGIQAATNAPTNIFATGQVYTAAATSTSNVLPTLSTTTATNVVTFTPSATATNFVAYVNGTLELPASANTVSIMASQSNSADLLTIKRGSFCELQ